VTVPVRTTRRLPLRSWADHGFGLWALERRESVRFGVAELALAEIVSFATVGNARSRAVMEPLGMRHDPDGDFEHPRLPAGHPLRRHVVYRLSAVAAHDAPTSRNPTRR
jgi:hypothetical protein